MRVLGIASLLVAASGFTPPSVLHQGSFAPASKLASSEVDAGLTSLLLANSRQSIIANVSDDLLNRATVFGERNDVLPPNIMRPPPDPFITSWEGIKDQLISNFNIDPQDLDIYSAEIEDTEFLLKIYRSMQLSRQFEVACNKEYMMGKVQNECILLLPLLSAKSGIVSHLSLFCLFF